MEKKMSMFAKLRAGLAKTREGWLAGLFSSGDKIDEDFYEELEEALIMADVGVAATEKLLEMLREKVKAEHVADRQQAREMLKGILADKLRQNERFLQGSERAVVLMVGVNGVGKTTSIGKIAWHLQQEGKKTLLAAGDTFRAAAAEQLEIWAQRTNSPIVRHGEGADPAAVLFDAAASFRAKGCDVLLCDTAGRLHNKQNLMNELAKMRRVLDRELPEIPCEVLLVLDATTGQNAIAQAKAFGDFAKITGIVLTKLDGTAKGGVVVAIQDELDLPVRFVGVGEGMEDLQPFDADAFASALLEG